MWHGHNSTLTVGMVRVGSVAVGRMKTDPFSHTSYGLSARFPDVMSATVGAPVYQTAQNRSLFCIFHQSQNSLKLHLNAAILPTSFQWILWEQCAERSSENTSQTNTALSRTLGGLYSCAWAGHESLCSERDSVTMALHAFLSRIAWVSWKLKTLKRRCVYQKIVFGSLDCATSTCGSTTESTQFSSVCTSLSPRVKPNYAHEMSYECENVDLYIWSHNYKRSEASVTPVKQPKIVPWL